MHPRRLLQEPNLTYKEAFETAQAMEITARDFQVITQQQHPQNVKPIAVHRLMDKTGRSPTTVAATIECYRCSGNHYSNKCNFQERTCHACGKKGYLASKDSPYKYTTHTIDQLEPCLMEEDKGWFT